LADAAHAVGAGDGEVAVSLVRDDGERHAVHRAARRHDEHGALAVLSGDARDVAVELHHLRGREPARDDAVEEHLRRLADAEHAHARVHVRDRREHERDAGEARGGLALAELPHDARGVLGEVALAQELLLVGARDDRHAVGGPRLPVLEQRRAEGRGVEHALQTQPHAAALRGRALEVAQQRADAVEARALVHRARALARDVAGHGGFALRAAGGRHFRACAPRARLEGELFFRPCAVRFKDYGTLGMRAEFARCAVGSGRWELVGVDSRPPVWSADGETGESQIAFIKTRMRLTALDAPDGAGGKNRRGGGGFYSLSLTCRRRWYFFVAGSFATFSFLEVLLSSRPRLSGLGRAGGGVTSG